MLGVGGGIRSIRCPSAGVSTYSSYVVFLLFYNSLLKMLQKTLQRLFMFTYGDADDLFIEMTVFEICSAMPRVKQLLTRSLR